MERDAIAARLAGLSPAKRALLERRRRGEAAPATQLLTIGRRPDPGLAPLSFSQRRMWFLDQLEPGSPTYNLRVLLRLSGPLDHGALAHAFQEVVRRHEVLRTAFREEGGVPAQVVLPEAGLALPRIDLTGLPVHRREEESLRRARELALGSFDLAQPPLLRVALIALGASEHRLLVAMHHIVSDGWSMGVMVREVGALYEAAVTRRPSPLPELPIQYADYAVWQHGFLTGEVLERDLGYWRERLAGAPAEVDLPTDRPRPAVQSSRGAAWRFSFEPSLMEGVEALARREGATPFMVLASGLFTLLSRLSGQSDLSIGSPVAGRNRPEVEGLIGFFVNTLVFRADARRAPDFQGLLHHVREVALGAFAHQEVPFERLVAELAPDRDQSRTPLFQIALALQNTPLQDATLAGLQLHPEQMAVDNAKFDLAFIVGGESGMLSASLEYATDLFDRSTAARLCGQWLRVLAAAVAAPEAELSTLALLSAGERQQILFEWNDTQAAVEGGVLLHEDFERMADLRPEALAAVWEEESITYRELEARANQLAGFLKSLGAGPGAPVGVWMDRSIDMLVSLLGSCKAGAAYLPIDASWPAERAEAVLAGTRAGIVLTRRGHLPAIQGLQWRLPHLGDALCLDVATPDLPPEPIDIQATQELWDVISERAVDWVTAGGFYSAYTGEPFSEAEVLEYRDRVIGLAEPWLGPDSRQKRVLEIGSGSGLVLWELAPRVERYVGIDPSERTQQRNRERAGREGHGNVELLTGFAHEIESLPAESFDLVILASTVQFFPGLVYLERVLDLALSRLAPGGAVVIADVMDPRRREDFRRSLAEYAAAHPGSAAAHRPAEARELHVDEGFFADLPGALPRAAEARVLHRQEGFPNELRFRYDVVLTRAGQEAPAAAADRRRSRRVWTGWHLAQASAERPARAATPIDIAYVIHTSGSTGTPKGIEVQHRPAVELCRWVNRSFGVGPADRLLFVTSPAFDLSVYDVFGVLGAGGTVHVAPEAALRDPERMVRLLVEEPITVWDSAPAALQQLAPLLPAPGWDGAADNRLRLVLLSGDWIPVKLPDAVRASLPNARVISLGGATEATVWSNWFPIEEVDPSWPSIPYGRPISNARYHVLDGALQPCPIGVPGDLYIGGACLCVGYARLPEMTAEKFIPDPFAAAPGERLYSTGDRARYGADGNLEFLGRVDQQVKVRGYRIELEEIEAVLVRQPGVREAAVVAREDIPGEKRLVGYVVPSVEPAPTAAELRAALQQVMPEYMVPWTFVTLEGMPVTANGKLDRKALPAPQDVAENEVEYVAPSTAMEQGIAEIWREVLGLQRVGGNDNFFDLGGSSLVAAQVISRVRQSFSVELPLRALFENRTLAALAQRIETLQAAGTAAAPPPLAAEPRTGALPLSLAQQRLWLMDQLEPGSPLYNIPGAVRLAGPLDPHLLRRALGEVVRRHEVLRTHFAVQNGHPVQVITAEPPLLLPVVDLAGLPAAEREREAKRQVMATAALPFDLARGPLLRSALLRLGGAEHVVLVSFHHIVADAWSVGIFFREIATLFSSWSTGEASPLPALPLQYADYAIWQRRWLTSEVMDAEMRYWREQLAGMPRVLELPTDRLRPVVQSLRGHSRAVAFPASTVAPLTDLARRNGATLFMALLGAYATLLSRYSGQPDFGVGTAVAGRDQREIEGLIGFFINTVVLRTDLTGDPGFAELLGRVRGMALGAFAHQRVPFERLVEELAPARDASHSPLFQVGFALQNAPSETLRLPGLTLTPLPVDSGTAKYDLLLSLIETEDGGLAGLWEYSTALFDLSTIDRLTAHLSTLLAGIAADPASRLSALPLLGAAERHQLLAEWNDTDAAFPQSPFAHQMFAEHARRAPGAPAVVDGARRLTYGELDARAEALAAWLRAVGVGPEVTVALCAERSLEMVLGTLAVVKAGGAYLPLDPSHPQDRLAYMISDSGAPVLLTQQRLAAALPQEGVRGLRVLLLDDDEAAWEQPPALPVGPADEVVAGNAAYIIYTSGSTGRPKGVPVTHGSLANMVRWHHAWSGLAPGHHTTQVAGPAFDATVFEIWPSLTAGACLHILDDETRLSPPRLISWLASEGITIAWLPTPLAETLLDEPWPAGMALQAVHTAGDRLHRRPGPALPFELHNLYGPTEVTVLASGQRVAPAGPQQADGPPPIGRPISNARIYLLDASLQPVPVGSPGEVAVGGGGLARGYLSRPDLTAERFIPDPFGEPGTRLYRTGDLARWLPDGELDFLGRADHQVKIRGFRVEPGEIAADLLEHPSVLACIVVAREDAPGEKILAAYLVPRPGQTPQIGALREFLAAKLPSYMVPSAFVVLEALPLTPNGKVDRAALPAPMREASPDREMVLPRTPAEQILAEVWAQVLGRERVSIHDNFFELGGDSILGIQVVSRAHQAGLTLTARDLFQYQTVAELAEVAAAVPAEPVPAPVAALEAEAVTAPVQREAGEARPEDFPEARVSQKDFNSLMAQIGKRKPAGTKR